MLPAERGYSGCSRAGSSVMVIIFTFGNRWSGNITWMQKSSLRGSICIGVVGVEGYD